MLIHISLLPILEKCARIVSLFVKLCVGDVMAVTDSKLDKLHGRKRTTVIELPDRDGLVASVGKSGKISWVFRYRFDGKQKRLTFGTYPAFTISDARAKAVEFQRTLQDGDDPKYYSQGADTITIEYCAKQWLEARVIALKPKTATMYTSVANKYFTLSRFPHDVQKARFEYWLSYFDTIAKETSKVNSGSVAKVAKTMLKWCRSRNIIQSSVLFDIELRAIGEAPKQGQRNLQLSEVGRLWNITNQSIATPAMKACINLLLIFGARNSEVRQAQRSELDLDSKVWTLPSHRSKTGKPIRRAIPEKAATIIQSLDEIYGTSGYLIKGKNHHTCMSVHAVDRFIVRAWGKMSKQANTEKFTPHDFRRTLATRLSEKSVLPHVVEKMLGHELGGVMAIYNKHDWIEEQAVAYELWCSMISEAAKDDLSRTT